MRCCSRRCAVRELAVVAGFLSRPRVAHRTSVARSEGQFSPIVRRLAQAQAKTAETVTEPSGDDTIRPRTPSAGPSPLRMEDIELLRDAFLLPALRQRGLHRYPPDYLGFIDFDRWTPDALNGLACDAFSFAIIRRLTGLAAQARVHANIDPLIHKNVRSFLTNLQAQNDQVGYRVFANLQNAAEAGLTERWLVTPDTPAKGGGRSSMLLHRPDTAPTAVLDRADIDRAVDDSEPWRKRLLGLAMELRRGRPAAIDVLRTLIVARAATVSTIAGALAPRARQEVTAVATAGEVDVVQVPADEDVGLMSVEIVIIPQFDAFHEWQGFVHDVRARLERLQTTEPKKERLKTLFGYLVRKVERYEVEDIEQRLIAAELGVPKSTLHDDLKTLKRRVLDELSDHRDFVQLRFK